MSLKTTKKSKRRGLKLTKAKLLTFGGLLFSLGVVASVTSTYAWYTLRIKGTVSNIYLSIEADSTLKLYLSLDKEKPLEELGDKLIHKEDGYTREDLGIEGIALTDVSGMFQNTWLNESTDYTVALPKLRAPYRTYTSTTDTGEAGERDVYVQNVFYIECSRDATIFLDGNLGENNKPRTYIDPNYQANQTTANEKGVDVNKLNEVVHAVRVSFLTEDKYVIANPGESEETLYGGILDTDGNGYYDVRDNQEVFYGEYSGEVVRVRNEKNDEKFENGSVFLANHMPAAEIVDEEASIRRGLNVVRENAVKLEDLRYSDDDPEHIKYQKEQENYLCHVRANEKKRIVVTIYIEGWDHHMTDDIASASFDVSLSFLALLNDPYNS